MRTFSSGRISVSFAVLLAAFVFGALVVAENATAREPEYEVLHNGDGGSANGNGEWKTGDSGECGELPLDHGRTPGAGTYYSEGPRAGEQASWAKRVEAWFVRLLKAVSAVFVQKHF